MRNNWVIAMILASLPCAYAKEMPAHDKANVFASKSTSADQEHFGRYVTLRPRIHIDSNKDLEIIKLTHPDHYRKIIEILTSIQKQPEESIPNWIKVTFDAKNISYASLLHTTYPPKRRLVFDLDDLSYEGEIIVDNERPRFILVK